jgi:SAM-dependent methyltransferase
MTLDYEMIRKHLQGNFATATISASYNLISLCKSEDRFLDPYEKPMSKYLRRVVDDVERREGARILVVGSASLDYMTHLQMLTKKEVYGIDSASSVVHAQSERIRAMRESENYDDLAEKFDQMTETVGHSLSIENFRKDVYGTMHHYAPFKMVRGSLSNMHPIRADAHTMPFADRMFDFVFFDCTIEYSPHPVEFFMESLRVLKRRSHLLMISHHYNQETESEAGKDIFNEILEAAERECFEVEHESDFLYARKRI